MVTEERLSDLLVSPREDLDFEVKNWLDLQNSNEDKATFAKAALALANHGGGFIALGLVETDTGIIESEGRPPTLDGYNQDLINGIVDSYSDPSFHCSVHFVENPNAAIYPIVVVPGGHRVPIRARRAGPHGNIVQNNGIYIRKPGPRSELVFNSQEWDGLLDRCLRNRRDDMFDQIRDLITGAVPQIETVPEVDRLQNWTEAGHQRWHQLADLLPEGVGPRFPHGHYNISYQILGDIRNIPPGQFPTLLQNSVARHTGWPPFWYPTREGITPYAIEEAVECWLGGDTQTPPQQRDAAHSDFWRISPEGFAFLLRGFQEDGMENQDPGRLFDITLPVWRVGESLLHAERLASNLIEGSATVRFIVNYTGLAGRQLTSVNLRRHFWGGGTARQDSISLETHIDAASISTNLPEIVQPLLAPVYALFDFFELENQLVTEELSRMREGRF